MTAAVLIPVLLILMVMGGIAWGTLVSIAAALGTYEFYEMARNRGYHPAAPVGIAVSFGVCFALGVKNPTLAIGTLFCGILAIAALDLRRNNSEGSIGNIAVGILGVVYIGGLLGHAVLLRETPSSDSLGILLILIAIAGGMLADTGAYFTGRSIGKRKLIPKISPGKTVEGTIGGLLTGTVGVAVITWVAGMFMDVPLTVAQATLLGFLISAGGVVGDLIESLFKRDAGVKDSGKIMPGHGGMLDRLDSLLWAMPITYYFALWAIR